MSPTATGPHVDETGARVVGEVGLLEYDDCQVSALHGLQDIFRVASEYAVESADPPSVIRVSTWALSATDEGPVMVCSSNTHPELEHRLSHVIIPPSLVIPELMTSVSELTDWLVSLRSGGTTLYAVCAGVRLDSSTATPTFGRCRPTCTPAFTSPTPWSSLRRPWPCTRARCSDGSRKPRA